MHYTTKTQQNFLTKRKTLIFDNILVLMTFFKSENMYRVTIMDEVSKFTIVSVPNGNNRYIKFVSVPSGNNRYIKF